MKSNVDRLDVDLSKLSDVVNNDVVKKDVYNAKMKIIEDQMPDITNLATKTTVNTKINEIKGEIPSITNLATKAFLNTFKNKISSVKKSWPQHKNNEIEKKITDHNHDKCITTQEFNKLTAENFAARLEQAK